MALEILENLGARSFESVIDFADTDYSTLFNALTVGYEYTESTLDWVKSPSNAITTIIQTNGSFTWLNFSQYGYQGGRLTQIYTEIIASIAVNMLIPSHISEDVGIRFRTTTETAGNDDAIKIIINRNILEVLEYGAGYTSLGIVDLSVYAVGADLVIGYDGFNILVTANSVLTTIPLGTTHNLQVIEFFTQDTNNYYLEMQIFSVEIFGRDTRNLNLVISPQLTTEYVAGDILIVSSHEGSDYGGDSIAPRVLGQFTPISTAIDLSLVGSSFQKFLARTLTASEPLLYQFTRGDTESYYDTPTCVGFIARGGLLEDLTVNFADAAVGTNAVATTISSNSSGAVQGDLVYGFAYNQAYTIIPSTDLLWYEPYPYGVSSLREATIGDDGIVRFVAPPAPYDYQVFAARISSAAEATPEIEPLGPYEQFQGDLAPAWLQNPRGRAWNEASGKTKDEFIDAVTDAVQARFVQAAPIDALGLLASDRLLERYPQETNTIFRARIAGAWDVWEFAGTTYGLEQVLLQAGWNCSIIEHWRTDSSIWAEFSVIVYAVAITPNPWGTGVWGVFAWGGNPQAIPTSSLRKLINKFKAGHSKIRELRIAAPNAFIWGQSAWGNTNPYSSSTII